LPERRNAVITAMACDSELAFGAHLLELAKCRAAPDIHSRRLDELRPAVQEVQHGATTTDVGRIADQLEARARP
jgi:hypothetical protein